MSRQRKLVIATRNPGKTREISRVLADLPVEVIDLESYSDLPEPSEDGQTFAENARHKACYYAAGTQLWALADDSGLEVDALDGAPGVHSARYAAERCESKAARDAIDAANNEKLLEELADVPDDKRTARFVCHLAMCDGERILIETFATVEGIIGHEPKGQNGFGYDPLFYVPELGCTTAELPPDEKNRISHRGQAVRHFASLLNSFLGS
ncbi:MAG: RdgB/HAM1 family non-canonical purine NTP pyrophosphatase [Planctomycetota bacterium]